MNELTKMPSLNEDINIKINNKLNQSVEYIPQNSRFKMTKSNLLTGAGNSVFLRGYDNNKASFGKGAGLNNLY